MAVSKGKQKLNEAPTDRGRVCISSCRKGTVIIHELERAVEWQSHAQTVCGYILDSTVGAFVYSDRRKIYIMLKN